MDVPIGSMFVGAVIPGLVLVAFYLLWIGGVAWLRPDLAPAIPAEERDSVSSSELRQRVFRALLPPLLLIVLVVGSIFGGVASPPEAAAMGSFGAIILTLTSGKFTVQILREVMLSALTITCMVFVILVGATFFGLVFRLLGGDEIVSDIIKSIPYGQNGVLIVVMALFFVLGFVLDFIEITFIIVPIMKPIVKELAIDPLWFSILIAINLQTSFLTPPFGFSLFYLKGVVPPNVTTMHIYRGVAPFVVIQIIGLIVAFIFPETVTWLPKAIGW